MQDKDLGENTRRGRAKKELRDAWAGTKPAKAYRGHGEAGSEEKEWGNADRSTAVIKRLKGEN